MNAPKLLNIASKFGTPAYIYDAETIRKQYHKLKDAFSGFSHQIHYAMKANENPEGEAFITSADSKTKVLRIPTNEELVIAMDTEMIVKNEM